MPTFNKIAVAGANAVNNADLYRRFFFTEHKSEGSKSTWCWSVSLLLAAALHIAVLLQFGSLIYPDVVQPHLNPINPIIDVTLLPIATTRETPKQSPPVAAKKELILPTEPTPSVQQPKKHAVKKKPVKKRHQPKPHKHIKATASAMQTAPAKPQIKPLTQTFPATTPIVKQQHTSDAAIVADHHRQNLLSKQYLAAIMALVKTHKAYPYSARRRHIEGNISVFFMIDTAGRISDIQIKGRAGVLCKASMNALQASLPFPPPPHDLTMPIHSRFIMQYRLSQ